MKEKKTSSDSSLFEYGGARQRVFKAATVGGATSKTIYLHGGASYPLMEKIGTREMAYIYGPTGLIAYRDSLTWYYLIRDHLNSTRVVFNTSGTAQTTYDFDSYGALRRSTISPDIRYRFTGQEYDNETALNNFRARMYDVDLGTFYATDPAGQTASPYGYAGGNPMTFIDPTGQEYVGSEEKRKADQDEWEHQKGPRPGGPRSGWSYSTVDYQDLISNEFISTSGTDMLSAFARGGHLWISFAQSPDIFQGGHYELKDAGNAPLQTKGHWFTGPTEDGKRTFMYDDEVLISPEYDWVWDQPDKNFSMVNDGTLHFPLYEAPRIGPDFVSLNFTIGGTDKNFGWAGSISVDRYRNLYASGIGGAGYVPRSTKGIAISLVLGKMLTANDEASMRSFMTGAGITVDGGYYLGGGGMFNRSQSAIIFGGYSPGAGSTVTVSNYLFKIK
jgi:RHS repeat-associated protein